MSNEKFYDALSGAYDHLREHPYHQFVEQRELEILKPLCAGKDVLEIGCGTGRIMEQLAPFCHSIQGIDASSRMVEEARGKGLEVVEARAEKLPFETAFFDLVVALKVLPHVLDRRRAMSEISRVLKPKGYAAVEFYNRYSIRGMVSTVRNFLPERLLKREAPFTRYQTRSEFLDEVPDNLQLLAEKGIRVAIPFASLMEKPDLAKRLENFEDRLTNSPARQLGGFMLMIFRKRIDK